MRQFLNVFSQLASEITAKAHSIMRAADAHVPEALRLQVACPGEGSGRWRRAQDPRGCVLRCGPSVHNCTGPSPARPLQSDHPDFQWLTYYKRGKMYLEALLRDMQHCRDTSSQVL